MAKGHITKALGLLTSMLQVELHQARKCSTKGREEIQNSQKSESGRVPTEEAMQVAGPRWATQFQEA